MADAPTQRQLEVLRFVGDFVRVHHYPPMGREISARFGWTSRNAVGDHFRALVRKGLLVRASFDSRSMRITHDGWLALGIRGCPFCGSGSESAT